ncbi:hypothetical protein D5045_07230 [Verminephrobacter eiseniae]|uniref:hypothetical protein n=1 Tax=Verminephrobacter eiseniae TaxID=364317 RepID=UPI0022390952|nr:hypothetical protein [Verminephrobacter eiseniae]MCW5260044.1 hypothetical protein [Verminephrobacter eiseniae]
MAQVDHLGQTGAEEISRVGGLGHCANLSGISCLFNESWEIRWTTKSQKSSIHAGRREFAGPTEYRGYDVVKTIFETLDSEEGPLLLPDDLQRMHERLTDTDSKRRLICDFVAGMTDRYAVEFYSRLRESGATIFKPL